MRRQSEPVVDETLPFSTLPFPLTRLLGREQEVAEGERLLHDAAVRLLTISGPGGVGKTRVAIEIATLTQRNFADGTHFLQLAPVQDATFVLSTMVQAFSLQGNSQLAPLERLKSHLRTRHTLLVLDNFEQVISAAPLLVDLLSCCPGIKMLVTSREVLHVRGEHELALQPLALPDLHTPIDHEAALRYGAIELFVERAREMHPSFQLTAENVPLVVEICQRLDGLPLGLELAAARLRLLSLTDLHQRLASRLTLLTNGARDLPERQQTLRATLQWSYDLLTPDEQRVFRLLACFPGGCTLLTLETIYGLIGGESALLVDVVTSLLGKHLIIRHEQDDDEQRLTMLETVREFGWEQLVVCQEVAGVRAAQVRYYVQLVEEAARATDEEQEHWFDHLEGERENLQAMLRWLVEHEEQRQNTEMALRLAGAVAQFWTVRWYRWYISEERYWVERALAQQVDVVPEVKARALQAAAWLAIVQDDGRQAENFYEESLKGYREAGNQHGMATAYHWLGYLAWTTRHDGQKAQAMLEECCRLAENDATMLAIARRTAGTIAIDQGNVSEAAAQLEESVALCKATKQKKDLARALRGLGRTRFAQGDVGSARTCLEESLARCRETKDALHLAYALDLLGQLALARGTPDLVHPLLEEALACYRTLGTQRQVAWTLLRLGEAQEEYEARHSLHRESLMMFQQINDTEGMAICLDKWGTLVARQEHLDWAVRLWGAAEAYSKRRAAHNFSLRVEHLLDPHTKNEQEVTRVRQEMGEQAFAAGWAEGQSMTAEHFLAKSGLFASNQQRAMSTRRQAGVQQLTEREIEVLRLVAQGQTDAQVAEALVISPRTVHAHMRSIYSKLGISSRFAAIHYALETHLL